MSELPDLSAQKPYALDQLAQLQGKIVRLSQSMVLQRARIERCRQSDLAAARDIYAELSKTREALVEALAQTQLFLMETEEYALAKVSGQLRQGLAGFALMSTGYKSVYEALSRFASSLPVGQKTNAAVVGRLMNNIKLGYYPTDPDNIDLLLPALADHFQEFWALLSGCACDTLISKDSCHGPVFVGHDLVCVVDLLSLITGELLLVVCGHSAVSSDSKLSLYCFPLRQLRLGRDRNNFRSCLVHSSFPLSIT